MTAIVSESQPSLSRTTSGFGMIVFIASDLMLFAAFFSAYFLLRSVNDVWPSPVAELNVTRAGAATAVLAVSSVTVIFAEKALAAGKALLYRRWLYATIALGLAFLLNQMIEYRSLRLLPSTDAYGSIYWMLTGLHAVHVTGGLCALALLTVRARRARPIGAVHVWSNAITAFWHVVDVVWICVFLTIWVLQ